MKPADIPSEASGKYPLPVEWNGFLTPTETGDYNIGVRFKAGFARVFVDGKPLAQGWVWRATSSEAKTGHVHLEQGKKVALKVDYCQVRAGRCKCAVDLVANTIRIRSPRRLKRLRTRTSWLRFWASPANSKAKRCRSARKDSRAATAPALIFRSRKRICSKPCAATGKPVVLVLANGSALAVNWAKEHVNAILESWYPGEEGGAAIAETLSGKNNPAGRLAGHVLHRRSTSCLPFEDYAMKGRTYRYFEGKPLYPFGYGLSYTTFSIQRTEVSEKTRFRQAIL